MNDNIKIMLMVVILILTKTIAQTMDAPTTTSYTTEEEENYEDEDEGEHDCCKDEGGCPSVSNSIYISNGTTFEVVCVGCTSDHKNFTLLWMVNGTVIENSTDTGFIYHTSVLGISSNFSSASVLSSTNLNRHDYDNSNITCVLKDAGGSHNDSFDTRTMNDRYTKIEYLKANNITLESEEEFNNYTVTMKK